MDDEKHIKHRNRWMIIITAIIFLILLLSILGATVFRARDPVITVHDVVLRNLDAGFDALHLNVRLNISLNAEISVYNPNKVGLKYTDSSALLEYRGQVVGQAPIPAGQISARQTIVLELTLDVMADRLVSDSPEIVSDMVSGTFLLTTRTKISGKVNVLIVKISVTSYAVCDMSISIVSKSLLNNYCRYDTRVF